MQDDHTNRYFGVACILLQAGINRRLKGEQYFFPITDCVDKDYNISPIVVYKLLFNIQHSK